MVVLHTAHLVALNYNFVYFLTNKMNLCIKHYSISLYLTFFFTIRIMNTQLWRVTLV